MSGALAEGVPGFLGKKRKNLFEKKKKQKITKRENKFFLHEEKDSKRNWTWAGGEQFLRRGGEGGNSDQNERKKRHKTCDWGDRRGGKGGRRPGAEGLKKTVWGEPT